MEELKAQETEALDILEAMLDVCDLDNPGPMFAGQHVRGGICKIMDDDAAKLRQYIAYRRAAPENKALTLKEMQSIQEPTRLWIVDLWGEMIPHYELVGWEVLRACPLTKKLHCVSLDGGDDFIDLDSYGRTWLAYARKPEEPHE